ncbi:MAG: YceI family protein [Myxococcaceae bacterium]|nr:YceI family protein [Myxococcaceae bacterium]
MRVLPFALLAVVAAGCPEKSKPAEAAPAPVLKQTLAELPPLTNAVPFTFSHDGSSVSWVGSKVTGKHEGGFRAFKGALEVVDGDLTKSRVKVDLELSSVFSDSDKLVSHLKSADFFAVDQFPTARFVSTSFTRGEGTRVEVTGELTLRGVTKAITFPADVTLTDAQADVKAEFTINRQHFGIAYPGKPDNLISDDVRITLDVHAKR